MKNKISRWTKRPPWQKSVYENRITLEKAVSALRCRGRTASIAFVYTLPIFQQKSEWRQTPVLQIRKPT